MYNPQYLERPYVVVLNKIDLPKVHLNSLIWVKTSSCFLPSFSDVILYSKQYHENLISYLICQVF
jgi:hypothetical protein